MTQLALPAPNDDDAPQAPSVASASAAGGEKRRSNGHSRRGKRRRSPGSGSMTREGILEQLDSLKGMVAAGWLKPAAANAITRILQVMLQCLERGGPQRGGANGPEEILADLARRDPKILDVLQQFLTDEQFDAILGDHLEAEAETDENGAEPRENDNDSV